MSRNRAFLAMAIMMVPATAANLGNAEDFGIAGNYGNAAGCAYLATGDRSSEELLLLTPEQVESYAALCVFKSVVSRQGPTTTIESQCADEGEAGNDAKQVTIATNADATVLVMFEDNTVWGPLEQCN